MIGVSKTERGFVGMRKQSLSLKRCAMKACRYFSTRITPIPLKRVEEAARAGFDMVVFDASEKPIEENIGLTRRAVETMKSINAAILVEGEIGYIGSGSDVHDKRPENIHMTEPADARGFVVEMHFDLLSPYLGTTHGMIRASSWELSTSDWMSRELRR